MNIGIVTTWFERGAAYVSKQYKTALEELGNSVFIFARGGEYAKGNPIWDGKEVKWGKPLNEREIDFKEMSKWISQNDLEFIIFNEQDYYKIIIEIKEAFPKLKIGAYVDYYKEDKLHWFNVYDFLLCNTKRHMEAMDFHKNSNYIRWGTDTTLFSPLEKQRYNDKLIFFHSVGMSDRKGTELLIEAFIKGNLGEKSKLIIHTQKPLESIFNINFGDLSKYNIEVICKTVTAPGLYYLGDVYVYPTRLDGLGLTIYEALASGLPVITTNYPPMNEVVNNEVGYLVDVERNYSRSDGYYWPLSKVSIESLIDGMNTMIKKKEYNELKEIKDASRSLALERFDWSINKSKLNEILYAVEAKPVDNELKEEIIQYYKFEKIRPYKKILLQNKMFSVLYSNIKRK